MDKFFPRLKKSEWLLLALLLAVYLIITLQNLTKLPIFVDEAIYLRWAQIAGQDANWRFISLTDGKQPLYIWLAASFMRFFQDPFYAGRLASVFSGIFTLFGVAYAGWLLKGKKLALFAGVIALFSPFLFFYNRFGVMEALLTAFSIWSFNISVLFAKHNRLDLAFILGTTLGFGLLVKSSANFFILLSPVSYLFLKKDKKLFTRKTLHYLILFGIAILIAEVINNIQRLSPWMHVISDKNSFFVVPYAEIFKEPARLWNNILNVFRWHISYSTLPVVLAVLAGIFFALKQKSLPLILVFIYALAELGGTAGVARLYAPRYIAFVTPFITLLSGYSLSLIRNKKLAWATTSIMLSFCLFSILTLIFMPTKFHYPKIDEGYVNGWSAGQGVKEISDFVVEQAKSSANQVYLYTEGTFGILPHGAELYVDGKVSNLTIEGVYPVNINEVASPKMREQAKTNLVYFVLNNTEVTTTPDNLELIKQYDKAYDTSMRLYRVIPKP